MATERTPEQHAEELRRKVADLEEKIAELAGEAVFADELDEVARRSTRLDQLSADLSGLRQRSFRWGIDLEEVLADLEAGASSCVADARAESAAAADHLRPRVNELTRVARNLAGDSNLVGDEHRVDSLERQVDGLEASVDEARQRIDALTKGFREGFDGLQKRLRSALKMLERFDERSFDLLPEEDPLAAVEAVWKNSPEGDKMKGLLLLTQNRLRFEQRDEVVTKRKFLLFAAEKEHIKKCWIDEPIGHLEASDDSTKGLIFKDQFLSLSWSSPCRWRPHTEFEIEEGTAEEFDRLVESVLSGEVEKDHQSSEDGAVPPADVEWPEDCPDCGARMEPPVKGQTRVVCRFCGRTARVSGA